MTKKLWKMVSTYTCVHLARLINISLLNNISLFVFVWVWERGKLQQKSENFYPSSGLHLVSLVLGLSGPLSFCHCFSGFPALLQIPDQKTQKVRDLWMGSWCVSISESEWQEVWPNNLLTMCFPSQGLDGLPASP